jgi:hypothetical protein
MSSQTRTSYLLILALLVAGCISISPAAKAAVNEAGSSKEIHELLTQVKAEAKALEHDAELVAQWARSKQMSPQSHAVQLNEMKDHVNQAGKLLENMTKAREGASAWQQAAIDRIYPLLKELADNTEATINHFNDNKSQIQSSGYQDYTKASYDLAEELAALIGDYVDYGDHEAEYHRLQDKMQSAGS